MVLAGKPPLSKLTHEEFDMIQMKEVTSAAMQAWGFEPASKTLAIRFNGGSVHHFTDVPVEVINGLAGAKSVGRYYAEHIRGKFTSVPVLEDEASEEAA